MIINLKNLPNLTLAQLLRRRRITLLQFIEERCVQSFDELINTCLEMGVAPPEQDAYEKATAKIEKKRTIEIDNDSIVAQEIEPQKTRKRRGIKE